LLRRQSVVVSKKDKSKLFVCVRGKKCRKRGSEEVRDALKQEIKDAGLKKKVRVEKTDCLGLCSKGPVVYSESEHVCYGYVTPNDCADIVESLVEQENPVERLIIWPKKKKH
jgi:(2Fe-2S) ferredoxin